MLLRVCPELLPSCHPSLFYKWLALVPPVATGCCFRTERRRWQTWRASAGMFWFYHLSHLLQVKKNKNLQFSVYDCFYIFTDGCWSCFKKLAGVSKCPAPSEHPFTILDLKYTRKQTFSDGEKVYYNCAEDFTPYRGSRAVQCVHGQWTKLTLKCESKYRTHLMFLQFNNEKVQRLLNGVVFPSGS